MTLADTPSVVLGSARRLDPQPYAGRMLVVALSLAVLGAGLLFYWHGPRLPETRLAQIQREARMAPWVVTVFFLILASAGATKRLFGFGKSGALGVLLALASLLAGASGLWFLHGDVAFLSALLVAAIVAFLVNPPETGPAAKAGAALGPMFLWTASSVLLLLATHLGLAKTLPTGFEAELATSAAVLTVASSLGLMPRLLRLKRLDPSLPSAG